jgi:predicted PurR-regulated permease PerM
MDGPAAPTASQEPVLPQRGRFHDVLDRRSDWIEATIVLVPIAVMFVVLGFLARYFADYLHLILIFFFAWLLAFLISPVADWIQRHSKRMPRPVAVLAVIVPVILIGALVSLKVVASLAESFVQLADALPDLAANPPSLLYDIETWLAQQGVTVDLVGAVQSVAADLLASLADLMVSVFTGAVYAFGTFIDAIIVISLAVFMAIDKEAIMRVGLDLVPPTKREDALMFRRSVGSAFAGFIRSQLMLGAIYGVWAFVVSLVFGLPFAPATAFLAGIIMAIPIYGPYVSWLPPVLVAILFVPEVALMVAIFMLIGWFIDENILAPLVRAGALELHPIVVTFAFLLGAQLAGAIGAIVAIPLAAVVQAFVVKYLESYRAARGWPGPDETADQPDPSEAPSTA